MNFNTSPEGDMATFGFRQRKDDRRENQQNNRRCRPSRGFRGNGRSSSNYRNQNDFCCAHCRGRHDQTVCPSLQAETPLPPLCTNCKKGKHDLVYCSQHVHMMSDTGKPTWKPFVYGSDELYEIARNEEKEAVARNAPIQYIDICDDGTKVLIIKEKRTIYDENGVKIHQECLWTEARMPKEALELNFEDDFCAKSNITSN